MKETAAGYGVANLRAGADGQRLRTQAEMAALREQGEATGASGDNPAPLRLRELEVLRDLARLSKARIYIGFDKHAPLSIETETD